LIWYGNIFYTFEGGDYDLGLGVRVAFMHSGLQVHYRNNLKLLYTLVKDSSSAHLVLKQQGGEPPGHKPRSMIEALRPKLQPTPHQSLPSRRSSLLPADGEVEGEPEEATPSNVAED
jgi:hypothetical protein